MTDQYKMHGVDSHTEDKAMKKLLDWINPTFSFRTTTGKNILPVGFFANVVDLGHGKGLALSMDGVGTKILIAEKLGKYDTIGIDCIAMNVNDLLCVGAEPISFMDYIGVGSICTSQIEAIAKGLYEGSKLANVNIPGGELAQVRELLHPGDQSFDLVGTAVGLVDIDRIVTGKTIEEGDVILGLKSSGIHSNGLTLARKLLLKNQPTDLAVLHELLIPTCIYVREIMALMQKITLKGMAHITGEGFLNILRLDSEATYLIESLPQAPSIFKQIQEEGHIPDTEMYKDFNMGIGFVVIIAKNDLHGAMDILRSINDNAVYLGYVSNKAKGKIEIQPRNILSNGDHFEWIDPKEKSAA